MCAEGVWLTGAAHCLTVPPCAASFASSAWTSNLPSPHLTSPQLAEQLGNNPALAPGGTAHSEGAEEERAEWASFLASLRAFAALERPWTLELTDPLDCSFIAAPAGAADGEDARLTRIAYDRTPDENELFGLAAGGAAAPIA